MKTTKNNSTIAEILKEFDDKFVGKSNAVNNVAGSLGGMIFDPVMAVDMKDFIAQALHRQREELLDSLWMEKKKYPPNIKQEIWGGEGGLPSTKIESPDVFGIKHVDGYNSAVQQNNDKITALRRSSGITSKK